MSVSKSPNKIKKITLYLDHVILYRYPICRYFFIAFNERHLLGASKPFFSCHSVRIWPFITAII